MIAPKGKLVVITGPSGVGKSTVVQEVLERTGARFSVSATTRPPRSGETHDRDYHFIDKDSFDAMVEHGEMLEWAEVYSRCYGTPASPVLEAIEAGQTIVLDIDLQGAQQVHKKLPDADFILILPPSDEALAERLRGRATENQQELDKRLSLAREEIIAAEASGLYNYHVVNDDLEQTIRRVVDIVTQEQN